MGFLCRPLFCRAVLGVLSNFAAGEERACCFALIVFLSSFDCLCCVSLPRGTVGLSVVCDRDIFWS